MNGSSIGIGADICAGIGLVVALLMGADLPLGLVFGAGAGLGIGLIVESITTSENGSSSASRDRRAHRFGGGYR